MKTKIIIIVTGSIIYALLKSIFSNNNHIIDLLFPLILSVPFALIYYLILAIKHQSTDLKLFIKALFPTWIIALIIMIISLLTEIELNNL